LHTDIPAVGMMIATLVSRTSEPPHYRRGIQ
jgi:hypothetical protein